MSLVAPAGGTVTAFPVPPQQAADTRPVDLRVDGLAKSFGAQQVFSGVSFRIARGEAVALVGANGAGKSTLLRILAGIVTPTAGHVRLDGVALAGLPARQRARALGYHAQNPELNWPLCVHDIIALGRLPHAGALAHLDAADAAAIERAAARAGVDALLGRHGDALSGGELARVLVARLLAGEHRVLLADEPIANLDPRYQFAVLDLLRGHADAGGAVVVVLHDLALAARYSDRLVLLDAGRVAAAGAPGAVLTPDRLAACFGVGRDYLALSGVTAALATARPPR